MGLSDISSPPPPPCPDSPDVIDDVVISSNSPDEISLSKTPEFIRTPETSKSPKLSKTPGTIVEIGTENNGAEEKEAKKEAGSSDGKEESKNEKISLVTEEENFWRCSWKKCPKEVSSGKKYSINLLNPGMAKFTPGIFGQKLFCTIIGNSPIPHNKVSQWYIKIIKSYCNNGHEMFTGVAPCDIDQNEENCNSCGWYFNCCDSTLHSGPPHNYKRKEYGPRREMGEYVKTGDIVGVVMDTTKNELSFVLDGENFGVAYKEIPLDKPIAPCAILYYKGDSVELI